MMCQLVYKVQVKPDFRLIYHKIVTLKRFLASIAAVILPITILMRADQKKNQKLNHKKSIARLL